MTSKKWIIFNIRKYSAFFGTISKRPKTVFYVRVNVSEKHYLEGWIQISSMKTHSSLTLLSTILSSYECLPLDPRDTLLRVPARPRTVDFYGWWKSVARTSFGGEVKPSVPCRRFTACKRTLRSTSEMLCRQNFPTPISHPCFSWYTTRWLCVEVQTSHLLLICTNLGYGTVLTAACARQGCSAAYCCCCCCYYFMVFVYTSKFHPMDKNDAHITMHIHLHR
jgi:hypothetical protein